MRRIPLSNGGDYVRLEVSPLVTRLFVKSDHEDWLCEETGWWAPGHEVCVGLDLAEAEELHRQLGEIIRKMRAVPWREQGAEGVQARRRDLAAR